MSQMRKMHLCNKLSLCLSDNREINLSPCAVFRWFLFVFRILIRTKNNSPWNKELEERTSRQSSPETHNSYSNHSPSLWTSEVVFKVLPWWVCPICPVQTHRCPPRGQARGERGSGPGASSALPRIQIGQCVVGEEGHREGDTHINARTHSQIHTLMYTDHEQEGVLPTKFLHWPRWEGPSAINAGKSNKLEHTHIHTHMTLP